MNAPRRRPAQTKIVATVGPACESESGLRELIQAGANVFRLNTAHGTLEQHGQVIERLRKLEQELEQPVGILVDLAGPKIRLGQLAEDPMVLREGDRVTFRLGDETDQPGELVSPFPDLTEQIEVGNRVLLADGTVGLEVVSAGKDGVELEVRQPGEVRSRQGIHLPGARLRTSALSDTDRAAARFAVQNGADFVSLSFVRHEDELKDLRSELCDAQPKGATEFDFPWVIAKVEKPEALARLGEIISAADGIMVARGDLGVETDVARLAVVQKRIIALCNKRAKPVITATQMLDSMQRSPYPTRAEATDVANAILDGTDACMLSAETAVGDHPAMVVKMMKRIAQETELLIQRAPAHPIPPPERVLSPVHHVVTHAAGNLARNLKSTIIAVASTKSRTAIAVAKQRSPVPAIGIGDDIRPVRKTNLLFGIHPCYEVSPTVDRFSATQLIEVAKRWGERNGLLAPGTQMVIIESPHWTPTGNYVIAVSEPIAPPGDS